MMNLLAVSSTLPLAQAAQAAGSAKADAPFRPKLPASDDFWQPVAASNFAADVDWLLSFIIGVSTLVVLVVVVTMIFFAVRYRAPGRADSKIAESQVDHNTPLEITWSIPPLVIFIAIFAWGFNGYVDMRQVPKDVIEVKATAQKWNWQFTYANGETDPRLHVPIGRDVRILIQAKDVLHSLSIPAFRVKMDAVPGRYTDLWFRATKEGQYPIFCTEYCGTQHSEMLSEATVESYQKWTDWVDGLAEVGTPIEEGEKVYKKKGCNTCHTIDGTPKIGPSWKGLFGRERKFADGSSGTADENYIKQSILEPNSQIVQGFAPAMPTYQGQLKDRHINGVIAYIKSLK